jgi:hypothetical protein
MKVRTIIRYGLGGILPAFFVLLLSVGGLSQGLPDKIRGYKVYRDPVSINTESENSEASVRIGDPELADISLDGITLELPAEFTAAYQSGKIEMITFHDLTVNGIKVEPEDYTHKFEFKRGEKAVVPKPVRIFIPTSGVVQAAWKEMPESRAEWTVTGRVFIFGKFRRYGFYHKRVVPIDLSLTIKNPTH